MKRILFSILAATTLFISPAYAATERMPCKYTEAKTSTSSGSFLWVACPQEGKLLREKMRVHFQGDFRDFEVQDLKLVPLDGPVGSVASPNNKSTIAELNKIKDSISTLITKLTNE